MRAGSIARAERAMVVIRRPLKRIVRCLLRKTSLGFGVAACVLAVPTYADVVWPALYLETRIFTWWAMALGLVIEFFFVRWLFSPPSGQSSPCHGCSEPSLGGCWRPIDPNRRTYLGARPRPSIRVASSVGHV